MSNEVHTVNCPSCGAPIEITQGSVKCKYCGAVIEHTQPEAPEHTIEPIVIKLPQISSTPSATPSTSAGCRPGGCLVVIAVIGVVLAGIWLALPAEQRAALRQALSAQSASIASSMTISNITGGFLVSQGDGEPQGLLLFTYNTDESNTLTYVNTISRTIRWRSAPLGDEYYNVQIVYDASQIYMANKTRLTALNQNNGAVAWEASLVDELPTLCSGCLAVFSENIVTLAKDGTLQSFDARTGQSVWSARLNGTPDSLLVVADQPAVMDEDENGMALRILNPANGSLVKRIAPRCPSPFSNDTQEPDLRSPVLFDQADQALYFAFGFFEPGCVQRWDAASGKVVWQTTTQQVDLVRDSNTAPLLADGTLYLSTSGMVAAVDTAQGQLRQLADEQDYELSPLTAQNGIVVVLAKRTRGTERYELWGLDSASGERRWQYVLQAKDLLAPNGWTDDGAWTWQLTPQGLALFQLLPEPNRLVVETLSLQDGVSKGQQTISLGGDSTLFVNTLGWVNGKEWLIIEGKVQAIDPAAGAVAYTWP